MVLSFWIAVTSPGGPGRPDPAGGAWRRRVAGSAPRRYRDGAAVAPRPGAARIGRPGSKVVGCGVGAATATRPDSPDSPARRGCPGAAIGVGPRKVGPGRRRGGEEGSAAGRDGGGI